MLGGCGVWDGGFKTSALVGAYQRLNPNSSQQLCAAIICEEAE